MYCGGNGLYPPACPPPHPPMNFTPFYRMTQLKPNSPKYKRGRAGSSGGSENCSLAWSCIPPFLYPNKPSDQA